MSGYPLRRRDPHEEIATAQYMQTLWSSRRRAQNALPDYYFACESHLTLKGCGDPLGSPAQATLCSSIRELTAQSDKAPPLNLYFMYEFHLTLLSSIRELTAQGDKAPPRTSTSCTSSTSRC